MIRSKSGELFPARKPVSWGYWLCAVIRARLRRSPTGKKIGNTELPIAAALFAAELAKRPIICAHGSIKILDPLLAGKIARMRRSEFFNFLFYLLARFC